MKHFSRMILAMFLCNIITCTKDKNDQDRGGDESEDENGTRYGKVTLRGAAGTSLGLSTGDPTNCAKSMDIYRLEGSCLTPSTFSGYVMKVDLQAEVAGPPTRIMSLDEEEASGGVIFAGKEVDLNAVGTSLVGNNQLTEVYSSRPDFSGTSIDLAYRKFTVLLNNKYVTVLIPSYDQPFASSAQSMCGFSADVATQQRYIDADLLPGMKFKRGDYLFCVKDSLSASCSISDYQWLDKSSMTLTSTRPSSPKTSSYLAGTPIECTGENERYGFNIKNAPVFATIAGKFKLYGDYSHGGSSVEYNGAQQPFNDPQYAPESGGITPYVYYTSTNSQNVTTTGTELLIGLNFGFTDSIFIENVRVSDMASKSIGELLAGLHEISLWVHDKKFASNVSGGYASHYAAMTATATVTLSGGKNPPRSKDSL